MTTLTVSVVILNYNGLRWLPRCLGSLAEQSRIKDVEIIVADNASTDGSEKLAEEILRSTPIAGRVFHNGGNLGYCEGNNRGASAAKGKYLFFLNTDTWLERDCLEKLIERVETENADSASPMVLDYDDETFQGNGASGFDIFGYLTNRPQPLRSGRIFGAPGCSLLIKREVFQALGGFDSEFFMYADEADLAWRLTLSGAVTVTVHEARVHHRGAAAANPKGGGTVQELRTNEMVRFYSTRNSLLVLLKNAQHFLLLLCMTQCAWIALEMIAVLILTRRWSAVHSAYFRAFADLWRLRRHVRQERRRIRKMRRHGDFWMLRWLRARPGRWVDVEKVLRLGPPKVDPSKF
ncbi:MAG TPA: glycosyltransferase family 2 protein [Verrucomicrobiae bacterium]|nr:glycosyltransferase family 2 protein [Verrucomicrobiae bacterium]